MSSLGNNEVPLLLKENNLEFQNVKLHVIQEEEMKIEIENGQSFLNLKHLNKSYCEILKSALTICARNTKFMFLMIFSVLPFSVFTILNEIKLQRSAVYAASNSLIKSGTLHVMITYDYYHGDYKAREFLADTLQISLFYLFIYPLLEFFGMIIVLNLAVKVVAAEISETLKLRDFFPQKINFKGPLITYLCVHSLSSMTSLGLLWIVSNYFILLSRFEYFGESLGIMMNMLSATIHAVIFLGLLYKFLEWSASWNMGVVISVTEEQTGIAAFGMADYYGKHCRKTGFQLMLVFFVFGNALRLGLLPCLYAGWCDGGHIVGVLMTCVVIMMVSLENLVKWVAFLLYLKHCKQQTMEKKVDYQELGKL